MAQLIPWPEGRRNDPCYEAQNGLFSTNLQCFLTQLAHPGSRRCAIELEDRPNPPGTQEGESDDDQQLPPDLSHRSNEEAIRVSHPPTSGGHGGAPLRGARRIPGQARYLGPDGRTPRVDCTSEVGQEGTVHGFP